MQIWFCWAWPTDFVCYKRFTYSCPETEEASNAWRCKKDGIFVEAEKFGFSIACKRQEQRSFSSKTCCNEVFVNDGLAMTKINGFWQSLEDHSFLKAVPGQFGREYWHYHSQEKVAKIRNLTVGSWKLSNFWIELGVLRSSAAQLPCRVSRERLWPRVDLPQ